MVAGVAVGANVGSGVAISVEAMVTGGTGVGASVGSVTEGAKVAMVVGVAVVAGVDVGAGVAISVAAMVVGVGAGAEFDPRDPQHFEQRFRSGVAPPSVLQRL
jgi:hypothetical protein